MHRTLLTMTFFLWILSLNHTSAQARISSLNSCTLTQQKIKLQSHDPNNTYVSQINNHGVLYGQISLDKNIAYFWSLTEPAKPPHAVSSDKSVGQKFSDIDLSFNTYSVIDSSLPSTNLQTHGMIIVLNNTTKETQKFNTSNYGGNTRSKYAISATEKIIAYVPDNDPREVVFYDLDAQKPIRSWKYDFCTIAALAFHPSGDTIAIKDVCNPSAYIFDIESGELTQTLKADVGINDDTFSSRNSLFFWAKGTQLATNTDPATTALTWNMHTNATDFEAFWFSPLPMFHNRASTKLALVDFTGSLNVLKMNDSTDYIVQPFGPLDFILAAAFSPLDSYLAVGGTEGGNIAITDGVNVLCVDQLASGNNLMQIVFVNENEFYTLSAANTLDKWRIKAAY